MTWRWLDVPGWLRGYIFGSLLTAIGASVNGAWSLWMPFALAVVFFWFPPLCGWARRQGWEFGGE